MFHLVIYIISILILIIVIISTIFKSSLTLEFFNDSDDERKKKIKDNDDKYFKKFYNSKNILNLINNNPVKNKTNKKNRILFITYENRDQLEYVIVHNKNINNYAKKYKYEYKFINECDKNVYWCKIYLVLQYLNENRYDYIIWLDSDTIIKNSNIDIGDIFNKYSSDIFIGLDNDNPRYEITNSGFFAVANTKIGKIFLIDCINYVDKDCFIDNKKLHGKWAASCYEQGVINILINDKYYKNTTVLTNDIIYNKNKCSNNVFIMHLYASTPKERLNCFINKK